MIEIPLTQGKVALVDDCDAHLAKLRWFAVRRSKTWYAVRRGRYLHRVILEPPRGVDVDHVNGDGLDCRRSNMRLASRAENLRNSQRRSDNTSGFKGVVEDRRSPPLRKPWKARVHVDGRTVNLGRFATREEAASAYRAAALRLHGEFACVER